MRGRGGGRGAPRIAYARAAIVVRASSVHLARAEPRRTLAPSGGGVFEELTAAAFVALVTHAADLVEMSHLTAAVTRADGDLGAGARALLACPTRPPDRAHAVAVDAPPVRRRALARAHLDVARPSPPAGGAGALAEYTMAVRGRVAVGGARRVSAEGRRVPHMARTLARAARAIALAVAAAKAAPRRLVGGQRARRTTAVVAGVAEAADAYAPRLIAPAVPGASVGAARLPQLASLAGEAVAARARAVLPALAVARAVKGGGADPWRRRRRRRRRRWRCVHRLGARRAAPHPVAHTRSRLAPAAPRAMGRARVDVTGGATPAAHARAHHALRRCASDCPRPTRPRRARALEQRRIRPRDGHRLASRHAPAVARAVLGTGAAGDRVGARLARPPAVAIARACRALPPSVAQERARGALACVATPAGVAGARAVVAEAVAGALGVAAAARPSRRLHQGVLAPAPEGEIVEAERQRRVEAERRQAAEQEAVPHLAKVAGRTQGTSRMLT